MAAAEVAAETAKMTIAATAVIVDNSRYSVCTGEGIVPCELVQTQLCAQTMVCCWHNEFKDEGVMPQFCHVLGSDLAYPPVFQDYPCQGETKCAE